MRRAAGLLGCILILLILPARALHAQRGVVRGHIADSAGTALPHAQVSLVGIRLAVTSSDQGDYVLRGVAPGTHTLRVRLLGYAPQSVRITVEAGATVRQDFVMVSQAISLSAIDVVVGSRAPHVAAEELEVNAADLDTDGKGSIHVKGAPSKSISVIETALAAHFKHGRTISGRGMFLRTAPIPSRRPARCLPPMPTLMPARWPRSRSTRKPAR